jgi:uncharacterized protein
LSVIALLMLGFLTACGQPYWEKLPKPTALINDFEHIFTEQQEKSLDSLVRAYEKKTTTEISIVSIPESATEKERFNELVLFMLNTWGVGKKDKNNGILIGISKGYRLIRISNGFGIEAHMTDEQTKHIIDEAFIPNFKHEAFYTGCFLGVEEIIKVLDN